MIQTRLQRLVESFMQIKSSWDSVFLRNLELPEIGTREIFEKPYSKSGLVYVCISTTARAISQAPIVVMQRVGKSKKKQHGPFYHLSDKFKLLSSDSKKDFVWEPVPEDNPWQRLFDNPNSIFEPRLFIESIVGYWLLDGNVWVYGFPVVGKIPQGLWIIRLSNMNKVIDKRTGQLIRWDYKPRGEISIPIDPWKDCLAQIKFWNPDDLYIGQKPLEAGKMELRSDYKAAKYNENFFDEGAQFGGIISSESKIDGVVRERLEQRIRDRHEGFSKAHRFMVLEGGLKFEQAGVTQKDMEFLDLRRYSREALLQIFGMKKAIISVTDDLNYATAMEQKRDWWESTLIPLMNGITSSLDSGLLKNDPNLWITFDLSGIQALKEDLQKKVEVAGKLWSIGFTANEINEKLELGFDAQPWRNTWYAPMNLIPVSGGSQKESTPIISEIVDKIKQIPYEGQLIKKKIDIQDHINLIHEANWKSFIASTTPLENILDAKVRNVFYRMRKKALKLLYQKSITDIGAEEFVDEQELIESYSRPVFEDAVKTGGKSMLNELGIVGSFDLLDPGVIAYLQTKPLKIKRIVDTVKSQVRSQLQTGAELGESIDKIADRIRGVFNVANGRARTIARTEVVGASNFGRHSQMMASNVKMKEWFCINKGSRIYTSNRGSVPIEEVVVGDIVWSMGNDREEKEVLGVYKQGFKLALRLATPNRKLEVSYDHPVFVLKRRLEVRKNMPFKKWIGKVEAIEAEKLKIGDYVIVPDGLPLKGQEVCSDEMCKLLGFWLGDGCWKGNMGFNLAIVDYKEDLRTIYKKICQEVLPVRKGCNLSCRETKYNLNFTGVDSEKLKALGFNGKCMSKRVPWWVWNLSRDKILCFLRGFADADGSVDKKGRMVFYSPSLDFSKDIASLLDYLGIRRTNIGKTIPKGANSLGEAYKPHYRIQIGNSIEIGSDRLVKKEKLGEGKKGRKGYHENRLGASIKAIPKGFRVERIKEIKDIGECEVYDLEVEGRHNFICEGIVVHNTALDEKVRPDHIGMHGTRVRIDEMFSMPDGSMLKYPGDWNGSPGQIINCRCISVAVIEEED